MTLSRGRRSGWLSGSFNFYHPDMQETLMCMAAEAGAEVRRGVSPEMVRPGGPPSVSFRENGQLRELQARLIVGADGRASRVRGWANFAVMRDPDRLTIAGALVEAEHIPDDGVHSVGEPSTLAGGTEVPLVGGATTARSALVLTLLVSMLVVDGGRQAVAHHIGAYTARDNDVSVNFKQVKFSVQAGRFDVAQRLFEDGALRREMKQRSAMLPAGLEASTREALKRGDTSGVETALAVLFAALARDLAREAEAKLAQPGASAEAQTAAAGRFLEAIWRYWNLVDFVINQRDAKAAAAMRLAFEEAEGATKTTAAPVALDPCAGPQPGSGRAVSRLDPAGARAAFARVREILSGIVETMAQAVPKPS